jgi:hypothetical protein
MLQNGGDPLANFLIPSRRGLDLSGVAIDGLPLAILRDRCLHQLLALRGSRMVCHLRPEASFPHPVQQALVRGNISDEIFFGLVEIVSCPCLRKGAKHREVDGHPIIPIWMTMRWSHLTCIPFDYVGSHQAYQEVDVAFKARSLRSTQCSGDKAFLVSIAEDWAGVCHSNLCPEQWSWLIFFP